LNTDRFRVRPNDRNALDRHPPDEIHPFDSKEEAQQHLDKGLKRLTELQELLYAQDRYSLLLIFQGMDAAGKDGVIKHVMSGVSPQGTDVHAFKEPSREELGHDFLWRAAKALPGRGRIGLFNRSYYEEVLVVRVHKSLLVAEKIPPDHINPHIWKERFEDINAFERHLWRDGTIVRKFFLHISKAEQARRLIDRIDDPAKNWKLSKADLAERKKWHQYQSAYADAIASTSHHHAPWYVVPSDHKWFTRVVVAEIIVETLESLDLSFPKVTPRQRTELKEMRRQLAHVS